MKILLIHNFYRFRGGEDRYVTIVQDLLKKQGHTVLTFFSDSRDIEKFGIIKKLLIPFNLIHSFSSNRKLETLIKKEKPDFAIVHNLFPLFSLSLLNVLKRNKVPILKRLENYKFLCLNGLFLRNNFQTCEKCKYGNFLPGIYYRCYQRSFLGSLGIGISEYIHRKLNTVNRTSDLFLSPSTFVKTKFVEAGFDPQEIEVYPNFIDFEVLNDIETPGDYAVYLGRLSREKGLMTLLNAFKELPRIPLKLVGDGPMREELETFVRDNRMENVTFEGFMDGEAKKNILKKAIVKIFPSECYESFGYTIVESFACGVPVIAVGMGAAQELIHEGENGFLFEPRNSQSLKNMILKLISDPQLSIKMRRNALNTAKNFYTHEKGVTNLLNVCQQMKKN